MVIVLTVTTATSVRAVEHLKEMARVQTLTHIVTAVALKSSVVMPDLAPVVLHPMVPAPKVVAPRASTVIAALVPVVLQEMDLVQMVLPQEVLVPTDLVRMLQHPRLESNTPILPPARLCKNPAIRFQTP